MNRVGIIQIGFGTVGGAALEQIALGQSRWRETFGIDVSVEAVLGRSGARVANGDGGFTSSELESIVFGRRRGDRLSTTVPPKEALAEVAARMPVIVMDASAGADATELLVDTLDLGGGVVLSNKAPLALPSSDARTGVLWSQAGPMGRLRYEATCGAGLPIISTLRSLLDSGDEMLSISGTVSGTFGAIFSAVGSGVPFSRAVVEARAQGYTEPDPRDDLSGLDVARKGLILARTMGHSIDLDDIAVHSLVPTELEEVTIEEFLARLPDHDHTIGNHAAEALALDTSLKYLMEWRVGHGISVGLQQVPKSTVLGALQGPENIVSFRTRRYDRYPCVISGPGAGDAVTAAGMIGDMLALAPRLAG